MVRQKICAWCGKVLHESEISPVLQVKPEAGICSNCVQKLYMQEVVPLKEFLNSINAPVLLVDENGLVQKCNTLANDVLRKLDEEIEDKPGGEVMECINSSLPGGCGHTVHCKACTIRNSVMATFKTGKAVLNQPAYLNIYVEGTENEMEFHISTERVGDLVFLRIEDVAKAG